MIITIKKINLENVNPVISGYPSIVISPTICPAELTIVINPSEEIVANSYLGYRNYWIKLKKAYFFYCEN